VTTGELVKRKYIKMKTVCPGGKEKTFEAVDMRGGIMNEYSGGTKNENRVNACYKYGSEDWKAKFNMLLDDGLTCNDCVHIKRCCSLFGQSPYVNEGKCQFYPNRFAAKRDKRHGMTQGG
jgi:hypothetical protein